MPNVSLPTTKENDLFCSGEAAVRTEPRVVQLAAYPQSVVVAPGFSGGEHRRKAKISS